MHKQCAILGITIIFGGPPLWEAPQGLGLFVLLYFLFLPVRRTADTKNLIKEQFGMHEENKSCL